MDKVYDRDSKVDYVDEHGIRHSALVSRWWIDRDGIEAHKKKHGEPGMNLLFVTEDGSKTDSYGMQIERRTSVVHRSRQAAPGNYWLWPEE